MSRADLLTAIHGNVDLDQTIRSVYAFAQKVWEGVLLTDFVDHGINHSFVGFANALKILEAVLRGCGGDSRLSDLEKAVLAIAALVHDVGMQWNKYSSTAALDHEQLRKQHVPNGEQCLALALRGELSERGGPDLDNLLDATWLIDIAGIVGFAHSGDHVWSKLEEDIFEEYGTGEQRLRVRLLAAAFRLADEIDNSHLRILDANRLGTSSLSDEANAHWSACYFIHDVRVAQPAAGVAIEVIVRVPRSAEQIEREEISELIANFRIEKMRKEYRKVRPFLKTKGYEPALVEFSVSGPPREQEIRHLPDGVSSLIRDVRRAAQAQAASAPSRRTESVANKNGKLRAVASELHRENDRQRIWSAQHTALRSGWHTNRYYQLSDLLSEDEAIRQLAGGLAEHYEPMGFDVVVGIGTTGARVGSLLAGCLGAQFQLTFSIADGAPRLGQRHAYEEFELEIVVPDSARVLLLDDIVGVGSALQEVARRLREGKSPPAFMHSFCILSLGNGPVEGLSELDLSVDVLLHEPAVSYWKEGEDGLCSECASEPTMVERED